MDQVNTQQPVQTQQPKQVSSPSAQKQPANGYFARLFSGRTNRRNYFLGTLLLALIPFVCLIIVAILNFFLGFASGCANPDASSTELMTHIQSNPVGEVISIIIILIMIVWVPFFVLNYIAITVRRLHDLDKTGWFYLLYFVPIVHLLLAIYVLFFPAKPGENKYGTQPLPRTNIKQDMLRLS